jgi:hypothetical protein
MKKLSRKDKQSKKKLIGVYKQCINVITRWMDPVVTSSTTRKGGTQVTGVYFPDYHYKNIIKGKIQKVTAELNQPQE